MNTQTEPDHAFETEIINAIRQEEAGTIQGAKLIQAGELVAFPTETVYGLGADGLNGAAPEPDNLGRLRDEVRAELGIAH